MRFLLILGMALALGVNCHAAALKTCLLLEHGPSVWNDLLISGLDKASRDLGVETEVIQAPPGQDQENIFRQAAESCGLVLVASDNLHEILRDNAANFRRVMFGSIDAGIRAANIMSVTFADEQAAYLAGVAAAMLAQPVGWLSGQDTPAMRSLFNGFAQGAALALQDCKVFQAVAGSFADHAAAENKARWLRQSGAKVIALAAGALNPADLDAGVTAIALDKKNAAPNVLGTIVKAVDKAVYEIIASAAGDKFRAKEIVVYDLANGGVDFALNNNFSGQKAVMANIARRVNELRQEITKGDIHLKSLRRRTLCDCLD